MLVYGDPSFQQSLAEILTRLRSGIAATLCVPPSQRRLDGLRSLLISAGQLEQAIADVAADLWLPEDALEIVSVAQSVTDHAAASFLSEGRSAGESRAGEPLEPSLRRMAEALDQLGSLPEIPLRLKVPEGFAFYTLYPEQYAIAAERWRAERGAATGRRVIVIGIRSIGTTLSAVVAATLRAAGCAVRRITLRPTGHPFARSASLPAGFPLDADAALIVDEGPGLSGSSMAAAAQALADAAFPSNRIAFLPGHDHPPGHAASDAVRRWWATTPRYVAPLEQLQWNGNTLKQRLIAFTEQWFHAPVQRIEDLSAGLWRPIAAGPPSRWPIAAVPFERTKYRCIAADGRALFWKFAGLGGGEPDASMTAESALARQAARASRGWSVPPVGAVCGFVATPWVEGELLQREAVDDALLRHLGRYIADSVGLYLPPEPTQKGIDRLQEMLHHNAEESLGPASAERASQWRRAIEPFLADCPPASYTDGRLSPHEWIRTPEGQLVKLDTFGNEMDHTLVGRQLLAWDIAGATVEWNLDRRRTETLRAAIADAGQRLCPPPVLDYFVLAYAAFRMGLCQFCADGRHDDPADAQRLRNAAEGYRSTLDRLLAGPVPR